MYFNKLDSTQIIRIFTTWRFIFFLLWKLPMGFLARLRVKDLDFHKSTVSVPYNYLNKNPFHSMYFAVQAMAAELATGTLVLLHTHRYNISTLVTGLDAKYYKKSATKINFICSDGHKLSHCLKQVLKSKAGETCCLKAKGYDVNGTCVAEFNITWSLKKRN